MIAAEPQRRSGTARRRGLLVWLPIIAFIVIGGLLAIGLGRDPEILPSALVGRPAPQFSLPPIPGRDDHGLSTTDLEGRPMLVNVFASWCVPCRVEHPILSRLASDGVTVQGINYKDDPAAVDGWLAELGDPFTWVGSDRNGRVAIEWGVYGVPETFVLSATGQIVYRQVGPIQGDDLEKIRALLHDLAG